MSINYHLMFEAQLGQQITCEDARDLMLRQGADCKFQTPSAVSYDTGSFEEDLLKAMTEPVKFRECDCWLSKMTF